MESFSGDTLTILVLVAVTLSGATFLVVTTLIICLLCSRRPDLRRQTQEDDYDEESTEPESTGPVSTAPIRLVTSPSKTVRSASSLSAASAAASSPPPPPSPSEILSVQSTVIETPVPTLPKSRQPSGTTMSKRYSAITPIRERDSSDDQKSPSFVSRSETSKIERAASISQSSRSDRQQSRHTSRTMTVVTDGRFVSRRTPYPPEIIRREQIMNSNRGMQYGAFDT